MTEIAPFRTLIALVTCTSNFAAAQADARPDVGLCRSLACLSSVTYQPFRTITNTIRNVVSEPPHGFLPPVD